MIRRALAGCGRGGVLLVSALCGVGQGYGEQSPHRDPPLTIEEKRLHDRLLDQSDGKEALDEPLAGETLLGTPVYPRTPNYFPAEQRDLFWEMDQVADTEGNLVPLDFDVNRDGRVDDKERDAIRGRNTWLLWGGGNETFWSWLQERGYGFVDFLILADSRKRDTRFANAGLINQPGFKKNTDPDHPLIKELGLYFDVADIDPDGKNQALLRPPSPDDDGKSADSYLPETLDAQKRTVDPPKGIPPLPGGAKADRDLFKPGDPEFYKRIKDAMPLDGLDYSVYGYPSGIFGLRLMLNPDFFGATAAAAEARDYWQERVVENGDRYYDRDGKISADPRLIRPFRMSMSCGFCHVAPHPLNPPLDPENPKWENLSSIIGNQYWLPQPAFANRANEDNFLHHVLKSQPPGTIDTSLVSTDHLNNTNVINAVFDVPARLERARTKPPEVQAGANLLFLGKKESDPPVSLDCPMVLFPGEDSVGVIPALARVPLNIGTFSEQWGNLDNPVIGFTPQRPFKVATCRTNSVYWMVNERYRVPYMAAFFKLGTPSTAGGSSPVPKSTQPMKLKDARAAGPGRASGADFLDESREQRERGRGVFLRNCAICHSSKQPAGFDLRFAREMQEGWSRSPAPESDQPAIYTLPMDYLDWEEFRASPALADYHRRIRAIANEDFWDSGEEDPFLANNFLSNELRIPVTLVATNSKRSMATNAMAGNVWDNYSSQTFKKMKSVGPIRYYNPFSDTVPDKFGVNAEYDDGREEGGPGYLRPPSLISLWATAPYFHNNALGLYNHNPSVEARMEAFDDGIRKLLNKDLRSDYTEPGFLYSHENSSTAYGPHGDLRMAGSSAAAGDPGYIYRLPQDTHFRFAAGYVPYLIRGVVGAPLFEFLSFWLWPALVLLLLWVAWCGSPRHAGILVLLVAVVFAALLAMTGLGESGGTIEGALMMVANNWMERASWTLWLVSVVLAALGLWLSLTRQRLQLALRIAFVTLAILITGTGILANKYLNGRLKEGNVLLAVLPNSWLGGEYKGIIVGPIPKGTPVDLMVNLDPTKKRKLPNAILGLARAISKIKKGNLKEEEAYHVFAAEAGAALLEASKSPDLVLDRGHWFGEELSTEEKENLIAYLKTM